MGIGAAARQLLPEVAQRLHTRLILPPHFEVGNALGAILIALQPYGNVMKPLTPKHAPAAS